MLALPYRWFGYALYQHKILCEHSVNGLHNLVAQAVGMVQNGTLGRACEVVEKVSALVHSPPLEGWQAKPDGVVVVVLH